jgi:hypothetical protein
MRPPRGNKVLWHMLLGLSVTHDGQRTLLIVVTYREHGRWARLV